MASRRQYRRLTGNRTRNVTVLIVTEGRRTEVNYINGLKASFPNRGIGINTMAFRDETDPMNLVRKAQKLALKYDLTYVVFDKDDHASFTNALRDSMREGSRCTAIPSVPCFELWLLFHFQEVASSLDRATITKKINEVIDGKYTKCDRDIFQKLQMGVGDAISRAKKCVAQLPTGEVQDQCNPKSPYTKMGDLVKMLLELGETSENR
jgi:RloB-like protein